MPWEKSNTETLHFNLEKISNVHNAIWIILTMVLGNVCLLFCIVFINAAKLYIWLGTKKIKVTVTSWHCGSSHIPQTFGIRQSRPFYKRITPRNQVKAPGHPNMHKQTMSWQWLHIVRQICASFHPIHLSFWTIIEHVLASYLYPSPQQDPFTFSYMIQIQQVIPL